MVREAVERSHRPMSHRPVMPRVRRADAAPVGDLVEAMDVALIFLGELLQPDVGALGHEDDVGHPGLIGGERLILDQRRLVVGGVALQGLSIRAKYEVVVETDELITDEALRAPGGRAVTVLVRAGRMETHPDGDVFFAQDVDGEEHAAKVFAEVFATSARG